MEKEQVLKKAGIDERAKIVSFEFLPKAALLTALEAEFWTQVMALVSLGYRLQ